MWQTGFHSDPFCLQFQIEMEHLQYDQVSAVERCFALDAVLMLNVLSHLKNKESRYSKLQSHYLLCS